MSDVVSRLKVVYIAGPYRSRDGEWFVEQNIRAAEALALQVWKTELAAAICPHMNTAHFGGAANDEVWLRGDLEILQRCDAVLCTKDWVLSAGARGEVKCAQRQRIPVFYDFESLVSWLNGKKKE